MSTSADILKGPLGHGSHPDFDYDKREDTNDHRQPEESVVSSRFFSFQPDLLNQIFELTVRNTRTVFGDEKVICPPLKLAHVCSKWRKLAMSSPSFWTNIELRTRTHAPSPDNPTNFNHAITGLGMVLNWSAEHPLSVLIDLRLQDFVPGAAKPLLDVFVRCASRWRRLEAWGDDAESMRKLFDSVSGKLPLLEHLSVRIWDSMAKFGLYFNNSTVTLASAPRLTTAILEVGKTSEVVLPYEQLQELTLTNPYSEPTSTILRKSQDLKVLKISEAPMESHRPWESKLPLVESLTLECGFDRAPFEYLPHLTLPNLSTLNLEVIDYSPEKINLYARDVTDFVRRSSCSITSLTLAYLVIRPNELISILEELSDIRQLKLAEKKPKHLVSSQLFDALKITPGVKPLLPALKELFVSTKFIKPRYSFPSSSFIAVIEGRSHRQRSDDQEITALQLAHVGAPQDAFTADEYVELHRLRVEVEFSTANADNYYDGDDDDDH